MSHQVQRMLSYCCRGILSVFIAFAYFYTDNQIRIAILTTIIFIAISFITFFFASKSTEVKGKQRKHSRIIAGITAFLLVLTFLPQETITHGSYHLSDFSASLSIFTYGYLIVNDLYRYSFWNKDTKVRKKREFWYLFLLFLTVCLVYFWAFFPGVFVADSINQWDQIHSSLPWNDWHPVGHTFLIKVTTLIGDNPITFIFFQITCYSLIMAYTMNFIRNWANRGIFITTTLFFLTFPLLPLSSIIILKDSAFTISLVLMTTCLLQMILSNGAWLQRLSNLFILSLSFLGIIFFRHNGWPVFLVFILLSVFFLRKNYLRYYLTAIICICCYQIITGPVYNHFNVIRTDPTESLGIFIQISAGIITSDGDMTKEQENYYYSLMSKENWIELYQPHDVDNIKFKARFNKKIIREDPKNFLSNTLDIAKKNPMLSIKAYIQQTEVLWHSNMSSANLRPMFRTPLKGKINPYYFLNQEQMEKYKPDYKGLTFTDSKLKNVKLETFFTKIFNKIYHSQLRLFAMPALYLIIFLVAVFILFSKGYALVTLAFLPYFLSLGTMFVAIPAQDVRYALPNYFVSLIALCLATSLNKKSKVQHDKNKITRMSRHL